ARVGLFKTGEWILDALYEAAKPDHLVQPTLERFTEMASARWLESDIQRVKKQFRGMSMCFAGYLDSIPPPNQIAASVTNEDADAEGRANFRLPRSQLKKGTTPEKATHISAVGNGDALEDADVARLRRMLEERRAENAITEAAVGVVREIASRAGSQNR